MSEPERPLQAKASVQDSHPTYADFKARIREAIVELGSPSVVWYRGVAKVDYLLVPSILRHKQGIEKEKDIFSEYEQVSSFLQGEEKNDWDMLADMQHYGIPTRLMDWTDVLGIAVAFALSESGNDNHASSIYILDPVALNDIGSVKGIKRARTDPNFGFKSVYWHGIPMSPKFPIAIDSTFHNPRMRAQRGAFTVHGRDSRPLDEQVPQVVRRVVLPAEIKIEARELLEDNAINSFSLYPDMVGMTQHIMRKYFYP